MPERVPFDIAAYQARVRTGSCFICGLLAGEPGLDQELLYDDGAHVAFLTRYPTLTGYALVAPRRHVEDVVRDLDLDEYPALQAAVHRVARAINEVVPARSLAHRAVTARGPIRAAAVLCAHGRARRDRAEAARLGAAIRAAIST